MYDMRGLDLGYTYAGSPLVAHEDDNPAEWDALVYAPHARPGIRIPHLWLSDGRALQDVLPVEGFTLLAVAGEIDGAPLSVVFLHELTMRTLLGYDAVLLRPDLHVAWRGNGIADDAMALARRVTGHR